MNGRFFAKPFGALALTLAALLAVEGTANAQVLSGTFPIDSSQEVPPNASPGTGTGSVTLDLSTNLLTWNITFSGLLASETAAHFHGPAAPGMNAGPQITLPLGSPKSGSATVSPAQAADIQAGLWYVNIHSTMFGGGEIRGQVLVSPVGAVPTMSEWGLALMALLLLGAGVLVLRRRVLAPAA